MAPKATSDPSQRQSQSQPLPKSQHGDLPTPSSNNPRPRHAAITTPAHLLPATALFTGPHSRNASNISLSRGGHSREDRSTGTPVDREQHLPRPHPPTSSFSGVPRPSLIGEHGPRLPHASHKKPPNNLGGAPTASTNASAARATSRRDEEFRADAVWAEMQKTLADVELSAMNSSHVFSAAHVSALEELRAAQVGLAGAWAKSEAVEGEAGDEEFGRDDGPGVGGAMGLGDRAKDGASPKNPGAGARGGGNTHSRQGSTVSSRRGSLEEETERDIKLARKRREANDQYFRQVNGGVLDVVKRLEEVVGAMRRVEKESREIWESSESGNNSGGGSGHDSEDLGVQTETDESVRRRGGIVSGRARSGTANTAGTTDSEVLTDSPTDNRGR